MKKQIVAKYLRPAISFLDFYNSFPQFHPRLLALGEFSTPTAY